MDMISLVAKVRNKRGLTEHIMVVTTVPDYVMGELIKQNHQPKLLSMIQVKNEYEELFVLEKDVTIEVAAFTALSSIEYPN